ncbi:uncharacterized protein BT62DRAFT_767545 [Guyanagaster necrorhizus]|uniref:Uncharacterized protein n=1 Tax=Guyanagaster necrorhizus TaxID=856835 RepID=A0A9P7VW00_9AGAR|nr:uncharacterized protein BT62DRAFT_767545 [Guyanagaster necrorhizus MCA 3950]KAG7448363.1 hypothetical protein BT62DRAFT_767545 [Guyanagaster necrorhizus MCA 3950]
MPPFPVPAPKPYSSSESITFPPPPKYADVMRMDNASTSRQSEETCAHDRPYATEVPQAKLRPQPSFDDIRCMQPDLPWEEVMKRAGNIDQSALARDMISQQGPERLEASHGPSIGCLSPQSVVAIVNLPESIHTSFNQSSMNAEEAMISSLLWSPTKDKNSEELKAFATLIAVWLHATITNESRTEVTTDSAR